ncbi:MAG: DUF5011 domain-containing protein [Bacteroidota bacterium]
MKKNIFNLSAVALIAMASVFTGCNKDDIAAPVVTLNGAASQTISLQGTYTELGATATDEEDGAVTPVVSGTVNEDLAGTYTITYTATDAAGNAGTATRTVIVQNDAFALAGSYAVSEDCGGVMYTFTQNVTISSTVNNRIEFNKFANYSGNTAIYAIVTGTTMNLPSQTAISIGSGSGTCDVANHTFASTAGNITSNGFVLTFTDQLVGPGSCTGAAASCTDTYTKQ